MRFEKFLLDDYLQTQDGKKVFDLFGHLWDILKDDQERFMTFVDSLLNIPMAHDFFGIEITENTLAANAEEELPTKEEYPSFRQFSEQMKLDDPSEARWDQGEMPNNSVLIFLGHPEYSFPYLFPCHFYKFKEICDIFEIPLPVLPGKTKHLDRCNYYFQLCKVMYDFRTEHHLSPTELCTFLYGFAPRFTENFIKAELPEANRVYIVGAMAEDVNTILKHLTDDTILFWQGTEEMLPGDIVIVYETAPYSRIGSIWRAVSPGFDDPFHYFPGKVFVGHPVKVPYLSFNELQTDAVWGKKGLVKAHMQGVNGRTCSIEEYAALKGMLTKKGFDISIFPTPPPYAQFYHEDLQVERDVEEKLLEPFLKRIGYFESDWTRQLPLRMGRGIRYFPDYTLHASGTRGEERADFIWEAKFRIPTKKQLREDFGQAKSYALRLRTSGFGLVSMEGVWISFEEDQFEFEKLRHLSWTDLERPDIFGNVNIQLRKLCKPKKASE